MKRKEEYYFDHDSMGKGDYSTHIANHAQIIFKGNDSSEAVGIILCNNRVVFHSGMDSSNILDEDWIEEMSICPECIREYKEE